jgi:outer membrane protein TolC
MQKLLAMGLPGLLLASAAHAQGVTEEEFLAALREDHAAIRSLGEDVAQAEADRKRAGTLANPRLEFWREEPASNPQVTNWTLAWLPPLDGRYQIGKKAADAGVAAARARLTADRMELRSEARRAFAEWSLSFERVSILKGELDLVALLAEQERNRARLGESSGLASRRFTLAEGEARQVVATAEADYAKAAAGARAWRPDLSPTDVPAAVRMPEPPAAADTEGSPQRRALEEELDQRRLEARWAGRFWGFPTLQFGWQTLEEAGVQDSGPILAANWNLPLLDRDQGTRLEAKLREQTTAARLEFVTGRLTSEAEGLLAAYRTLFDSARNAEATAQEALPVIEAATQAYRAGEIGLTDFFESLRSAFGARTRETEARGAALELHRNLEVLLGRPLVEGDIP